MAVFQPRGGSLFESNIGADIIGGLGNVFQQFQSGQQQGQNRQQQQQAQALQNLLVQSQTQKNLAGAEALRNPPEKQRSFADQINEQKFGLLRTIVDPNTPPEMKKQAQDALKAFSSPGVTVNTGEGESFTKQFDRGFKLSGQFKAEPIVKTFPEIQKSVDNMEAAFEAFQLDPSTFVAIDQALISSFNKILDPGSVVRESEFERTAQSLGLPQRIIGSLVKLTKGGAGLSNTDRLALVELARDLQSKAEGRFNEKITEFEKRAVQARVPRDFVLAGVSPFEPRQPKEKSAVEQAIERLSQQPQASPAQITSPKTKKEFDAIPAGTIFIDTDGKRKVKQ